MKRVRLPSAGLLMALAVLMGPWSAVAQEGPRLRVGFDGSYKTGCWTPIEVDFGSEPGDVSACRVRVPDPDGNETIAPLAQDSAGRFVGEFRSGRLYAPIRVEADSRVHTLAALDGETYEPGENAIRPARQSVQFLGVVGSGDLIEQAVAEAGRTADAAPAGAEWARVIRFRDWSALPTSEHGLDALDVLFVSESFPATDQQSDVLRNWVRRGGHLVLSLGDHTEALQSSPLAAWVPAGISGTRTVIELATIADRVRGAGPLPARNNIVAARLNAERGEVLLSTYEGPLAARFAYGVGRVTVFALDYQAPPMGEEWDGTPKFCLYLADLDPEANETAPQSRLQKNGVSDLATQLAAGLDWFPEVEKPSYGAVLVAVLCFLLIVGPVDYVLVHRLLKRPRRTWITFPAVVLVAAGWGAVVARQAHPRRALVNQLDLVDLDVSLSTARIRSWATVYSPAAQRREIEFTTQPWIAGGAGAAARVSWFGKPESGFRGMYRAGGLDLGSPDYEFAPEYASILNLPIDQWSTKTLSADWERPLEAVPVQSTLKDDGTGKLSGSLTHQLPGPITDWMLAYGAYVYFPGSDSPESEIRIAPGVPLTPAHVLPVPRILQRVLVGYHNIVVDRGDKVGGDTTTPGRRAYDPLDRDPLRLMQTITFYDAHDAAGGRKYTELTNSALARNDLTPLLSLRRAVLLGRIAEPGTRCAVGDDADLRESSTFIRIILPVEPPDPGRGD